MSYPGNANLPVEMRQRVTGTFQQTLDLAARGSHQEAVLGCDFVLRLDPDFEPARILQQRLQATPGALDVTDLVLMGQAEPPVATAAAAPVELLDDLDDLSLELPDLPSAGGSPPADVGQALRDHFEARRYQALFELADREKRAVQADPALRALLDQARARQEAEPYLETFLNSAREALQGGDLDEADRLIKKARSLDPTHPRLVEIEQTRGFYADPERRMGARRRGIETATPPGGIAPIAPLPGAAPAPFEVPSFETPGIEPAAAAPEGSELGPDSGLDDFGRQSFDLESQAGIGQTLDGDTEKRIANLLQEGQQALDKGNPQGAIDTWSRIFLIDIDNQEAARRIEQARSLKAERERAVEEVFHDAVARFDAGERETARAAFQQVLELQPGYLAAREYLDLIDEAIRTEAAAEPAGEVLSLETGEAGAVAAERAARPPAGELKQEIMVPPEPGTERRATQEFRGVAMVSRSGRRRFMMIGGLVLVVAVGGGWFLWNERDRLFPNAKPVEAPAPAVVDPIARARALQSQGKTAIAVAQLRRLPPGSPSYNEAQTLISQWEALEQPKAPSGPPPELLARREGLVASARDAYSRREYLRASSLFEQAAAMSPLEPQLADLADDAKRQLEPLTDDLTLFRQGEWESALTSLWRKHEKEPGNRDIARLIADSYYNLGVRDLQRGDPVAAGEKFKEALALDPNDAMLLRLSSFARTYHSRGEDLLYRTFVKYLPNR